MHPEILTTEQEELLPFLAQFEKDYYLVGGTAIALQVGHRLSIDFDMFTEDEVKGRSIKKKLQESKFEINSVGYSAYDQFHCEFNKVNLTFFKHLTHVPAEIEFEGLRMPNLLDLAAMKAEALGERTKWKDYVDLYFIIKDYHSVNEIIDRTEELFGVEMFNDRLFRQQLSYFEDLKYRKQEPIEYLDGFGVSDDEIKSFLREKSLEKF